MKNMVLIVIALVVLGALPGCDKSDTKSAVLGVDNYRTDNSVQGQFLGTCVDSNIPDIQSRTKLSFDGAKFTMEKYFYSDSECSKEEIGTAMYKGTFDLDQKKLSDGTVKTLTIALNNAQIQIQSDLLATAASAVNYCGVSNYEVGKTYDVTPNTPQANCFVTTIPVTYYGSYSVTKNDKGIEVIRFSEKEISKFATIENERSFEIKTAPEAGFEKHSK